jgi:hypothetical protein
MEAPRVRPVSRKRSRALLDEHAVMTRARAAIADDAVSDRLPKCFFVGPMRTATTWAWQLLKDHVNVAADYKELFFFSQNFYRGFDWYLAHFERIIPGRPRIDIEPEYFPSALARQRIAAFIPEARIVCSLRDPVERLFSSYKVLARSASIPACTFEEACEKDWRLAEAARYGSHLEAWMNAFGTDKILVLFYEDLLSDPQAYADKIFEFVGIESRPLSAELRSRVHSSEGFTTPRSRLWTEIGKAIGLRIWEFGNPHLNQLVRKLRLSSFFYDIGAPFVPPDPAVVSRIKARLRPEIERVECLTGRDLSAWKDVVGDSEEHRGHPAMPHQVLVSQPGSQ